jgi:hypothetical protein
MKIGREQIRRGNISASGNISGEAMRLPIQIAALQTSLTTLIGRDEEIDLVMRRWARAMVAAASKAFNLQGRF